MTYSEKMDLLQRVFDNLLQEVKKNYTGKIVLHFLNGEIKFGDFKEQCEFYTKEERKNLKK